MSIGRRQLGRTGSRVALVLAAAAVAGVVATMANGSGDPPLFLITPTSLDFGYVPVGSAAKTQEITIKNVSGVPQTMSGAGGGAGVFGGAQNCQGTTLAKGKSCHMFYAFSPTSTGTVNGSTNGTWNGQEFDLSFTGTGTPQFLITPTSLDFGNVPVGRRSKEQIIKITNLSNKPAVMSGAGGGAGVFGGAQNCQGTTLQPHKSCKMFYAFSPTSSGPTTGSTNGTWNGQPFDLTFTGTGT
jgi:hypothetical protein